MSYQHQIDRAEATLARIAATLERTEHLLAAVLDTLVTRAPAPRPAQKAPEPPPAYTESAPPIDGGPRGMTLDGMAMGALPLPPAQTAPSPLMAMLSAPLPGKAGPPELYPGPLTPGVTNPAVTQETIATTIAVPGYTATIRPPVAVTSKIKAMIMQRDGLTDPPSAYELDHAISLELGGSPDAIGNLWCEHYADATHDVGAKQKDRVENWLHQQVIAGRMSLLEAQTAIMADWYKIYLSLNKMGMLPMLAAYDPDGSSDPDDNA